MATPALDLPIEIVQSVLCLSNPETFHSARQVCRAWRYAASSALLIGKQLRNMPVQITPEYTKAASAADLNAVFNQVAHANLLGVRQRIRREALSQKAVSARTITSSADGSRMAEVARLGINVYKNRQGRFELWVQRSLTLLWEGVSRARSDGVTSWMSVGSSYAKCQITLSATGLLLAVALGRTVQVYDLQQDHESDRPIEYVLSSNRNPGAPRSFGWSDIKGVIEGIEFVEDDTLLRISMGKEGVATPLSRVVYLGSPVPPWGTEKAHGENFDFWKANLSNTYLDSVELAKMLQSGCLFRGFQLLPRKFGSNLNKVEGRFFTTAVHGPKERQYCVGFISQQKDVSIIARIQNRDNLLSQTWSEYLRIGAAVAPMSHEWTLHLDLAERLERWHPLDIPESKTIRPIIAVSEDRRLMAMYEPEPQQDVSPGNGGAIYICTVPEDAVPVAEALNENIEKGSVFAPNLLHPLRRLGIQSWPLRLEVLPLEIHNLSISRAQSHTPNDQYTVLAETDEFSYRWSMS